MREGKEGQLYLGVNEILVSAESTISKDIDVRYKGIRLHCTGVVIHGKQFCDLLESEGKKCERIQKR